MKDGELDGKGGRWCDGCVHSHGPLYVCPKYSAEVRAGIEAAATEQRDRIRDPKWCAEQQRNGMPEMALQISGMFASVTPRSGRPS